MASTFITVVCFCLTCLRVVSSFPNGPPRSACADGLPIHVKNGSMIPPQTSASHYIITVNVTEYSPGDTVEISVQSFLGKMFKGLLLQVRPVPNNGVEAFKDTPIGEYHRRVTNTKMISCVNSLDTIVHKDGFVKIKTKLDWKSPLLIKHDVKVTATILEDFETYWTNVESVRIKLLRGGVLPAEKMEKPWVEEIIKSVKVRDDKEARRRLTRERFEKGYSGAMDPNGYIMVQYVNDLLPFEDRFPGDHQIKVIDDNTMNVSSASNSTEKDAHHVPIDTTTDGNSQEPTVEIPLGVKIQKGNSGNQTEYDMLVKSLLSGDYSQIDKLENLIKADKIDTPADVYPPS